MELSFNSSQFDMVFNMQSIHASCCYSLASQPVCRQEKCLKRSSCIVNIKYTSKQHSPMHDYLHSKIKASAASNAKDTAKGNN